MVSIDVQGALQNAVNQMIEYIPQIIAAIIILIVGYYVGKLVARAVNRFIDRTLEKSFEKTSVGRSFREAGIDLSDLTGGLVLAFIVVIAIVLAIQTLNIGGMAGALLAEVAVYLPKLLAGVFILTYGLILAALLSSFIGSIVSSAMPKEHSEIADMIKNTILVGLVALVITIALNTMMLGGALVYTLILGFVLIALGIFIGNTLVKAITDEHPEFKEVAGYAKFLVYLLFTTVGLAAIFSEYPYTARVVGNLAWGVAIAFAIFLVPIIFALSKRILGKMQE